MSELINAYTMLMDDELFIHKVGADNRVALACEMFTLEELRMDRFHHVYSIRIRYSNIIIIMMMIIIAQMWIFIMID